MNKKAFFKILDTCMRELTKLTVASIEFGYNLYKQELENLLENEKGMQNKSFKRRNKKGARKKK